VKLRIEVSLGYEDGLSLNHLLVISSLFNLTQRRKVELATWMKEHKQQAINNGRQPKNEFDKL
jgi:hypothetical protein